MKTPILSRFLDTVGNGTGSKNFNGNYAVAAEQALITGPCILSRMIITVEDTATMQAEEYGNLGAALTNGIEIKVYNEYDTVIMDLTDGVPVKTNAGWGSLCYDVDLKSWGAGNELLLVRWTFERSGKRIYLESGQYLAVNLNDDFTGLVEHRFLVQGYT